MQQSTIVPTKAQMPPLSSETSCEAIGNFGAPAPSCARDEDEADLRRLIEDIVAGVFEVEPEDLRRPTRGLAKVALARQVAMYIAHVGWALTLTEVGRQFGRDRTTVAHACRTVETKRDDPQFDAAVVLLELIVRAVNLPGGAKRGGGPSAHAMLEGALA